MENNDLTQYPLARLFAWRQPFFVGSQGATEEAAERREIKQRVLLETAAAKRGRLEAEEYADLL